MDFENFQNPLIVLGKIVPHTTYQHIYKIIENWIKQRDTTRYFTKIWKRNISFNIKQNKKLLGEWSPPTKSSVAVLVSTGPSLEKEIQNLVDCKKVLQDKLCIVSVPGAIEFLNFFNIFPDFVVSTDGGFYNDYHFRYLSRVDCPPPLVSPYSIQKNVIKNYPGEVILFFDDLSWVEKTKIFLQKEDFLNLAENLILSASSVTGCALRILQYFFYVRVATIGVDFEITPFLFHSSCNTSEEVFFQKGFRLYPFEHWYQQNFFQKLIKRGKLWGDPKLDIYHEQFQKILTQKNTNLMTISALKESKDHKRIISPDIEKRRIQSVSQVKSLLQKIEFTF